MVGEALSIEELAGYYSINDLDSFNAQIDHKKNALLARAEYPGVNGDTDTVVGPYAKSHETRHILHRRIMEDLLKEDPKVFEFFKQDIKNNKRGFTFTERFMSKLFGKRYRNDYQKLEEIFESTKTEEDVVKNAEMLSTYMATSYFGTQTGLMENFANNGRDLVSTSAAMGVSGLLLYSGIENVSSAVDSISHLIENHPMQACFQAARLIGCSVLTGMILHDTLKLTKEYSTNKLSDKNFEEFTPKHRKYLVSLPSKQDPKARLEEMRAYGLGC